MNPNPTLPLGDHESPAALLQQALRRIGGTAVLLVCLALAHQLAGTAGAAHGGVSLASQPPAAAASQAGSES